jgi:hypothetical protein
MNKNRELEILLDDILVDHASHEISRTSARLNFRRNVRRRKFLRGIVGGVSVLSLMVVGLMPYEKDRVRSLSAKKQIEAPHSIKSAKIESCMSDDELLRSFPPGSCFLAEVNGKTVLVFTDESVKRAVMN